MVEHMAKGGDLENLKQSLDLVFDGLKGDLMRARAVVRDAVGHLLASFRGLEGAVATQRELLASISTALRENAHKHGEGLTGTTSKLLREFVEQVVRVSGTSMQIIEHLMVLSEHIDMISKDTSGIDQLARESRFIAFNARIETQRAGDAGVTFKVVAEEIKRLAGASATLSSHIRQEVAKSVECLGLIRKSATDLASHDMNTAIESRSGLFDVVRRLDEVNGTLEGTVARVTTLIADATRSMQFEDMLTQLLDGISKKVISLGTLTKQAFDAMASNDRAGSDQLHIITRLLSELAQPGAVAQTNMSHGEIELF
ncbi:MAG: methyl-accepting chemotaxis protein [Deltaproteobacteria bacterium]|nr:methyl-accepting chemotaxis protein [Deltaproteobacteria bacterium]